MDYREEKIQWVTGHNGTSYMEVLTFTLVSPAAYALWTALDLQLNFHFLHEYILFVAPIFLSYITPIISTIFGLTFGFAALTFRRSHDIREREQLEIIMNRGRKRYIDVFRALMMLHTCAAILAVDFPIFPRRFAKVETYGISLMDIGVGCFVFSQGRGYGRKIRSKESSVNDLTKAMKSYVPLLFMGFLRLILVKSTNYQEHVSEYGTHWNFFFTLSVISLIAPVGRGIARHADIGVVGAILALCYEVLLSWGGLSRYIIEAPRVDFLSSNREGVFGVIGYASILFLSMKLGDFLFRDRSYDGWKRKVFPQLASCTIFLGVAYFAFSVYFETSRRMVNAMYVLCVISFCVTLITACMLAELTLPVTTKTPAILTAINDNQLATFLIANLLTGTINSCVKTIFLHGALSLVIIGVYLMVVCLFAMSMRRVRVF